MVDDRSYIGIDNGVSGSIAFISPDKTVFMHTPIKKEQNYTKKKQSIQRIDWRDLSIFLYSCADHVSEMPRVFIERPFVNPTGFKATASALRSLEATLVVLEMYQFPYQYIDSKQWQSEMLAKGYKGTAELKYASMCAGIRLWPEYEEAIRKHKDADSLLIAEWARRNRL
jgi:hypothetical protein